MQWFYLSLKSSASLGRASPEDVHHDVCEEQVRLLVERGVQEMQAELLEQLLVPSCLPGLHLRLIFGDLLVVVLRPIAEYRLHEYDEATGLDTCLHLEQDSLEIFTMQVAEAPDAQDAIIPNLGPEVVLDESLVADEISRHLGDHLVGPIK